MFGLGANPPGLANFNGDAGMRSGLLETNDFNPSALFGSGSSDKGDGMDAAVSVKAAEVNASGDCNVGGFVRIGECNAKPLSALRTCDALEATLRSSSMAAVAPPVNEPKELPK